MIQIQKKNQMNKQYIFAFAMLLLAVISCDELPDEQFEKQVLFARNGIIEKKLEITETETIESNISVSVSGTSILKKQISFTIAEFADTLEFLNQALFFDKTEDYYSLFPDTVYAFKSYDGTIKKGQEYTTVPFTVNWKKLNMYEKYLLPLKITSVSDYKIATGNVSSILVKFKPFNNYSGSYAGNLLIAGKSIQKSGIEVNALTPNSCYITSSLYLNEEHTFIVKVNPDNTLTVTAKNPDELTLEIVNSGNPDDLVKANIYEETETMKKLEVAFKYKKPEENDFIKFEGILYCASDKDNAK